LTNELDRRAKGVRNPLSIIALFISFIYALSAGVLGVRSNGISEDSETILVWFIVVFPPVVLFVFAWLVSKHHIKLYAPLDFRSDESFLSDRVQPSDVGRRLQAEVAEADLADSTADLAEQAGGTKAAAPRKAQPKPAAQAQPAKVDLVEAFVGEALAFQELQNEFAGSVRREVILKGKGGRLIRVDGLIESDTSRYVIEVKIQTGASTFLARVNTAIRQVLYLKDSVFENALKPYQYVIVIVATSLPSPSERGKAMARLAFEDGSRAELRVYLLSDLIAKYGLTS
jgi:hypothetical protein